MSDDSNIIDLDAALIQRLRPQRVSPAPEATSAASESSVPDALEGHGYRVGAHGYGYGPFMLCGAGGRPPPPPSYEEHLTRLIRRENSDG